MSKFGQILSKKWILKKSFLGALTQNIEVVIFQVSKVEVMEPQAECVSPCRNQLFGGVHAKGLHKADANY